MTTTAVACVILFAGCAYRHGDVVREGNLRIELSPPSGPEIYGVNFEKSDGRFIVTGFGKRPTPYGRVDVVIASKNGEVLGRTEATILPPLPVPKRSYNYRFRAVLPWVPPDGSLVRVRYRELGRDTSPRDGADNSPTQDVSIYRLRGVENRVFGRETGVGYKKHAPTDRFRRSDVRKLQQNRPSDTVNRYRRISIRC